MSFFQRVLLLNLKTSFRFRNLIQIITERKTNLSWHFSQLFMEKACFTKLQKLLNILYGQLYYQKECIDQLKILLDLFRKKNDKIILIKIKEIDIDNSKIKLENIFKTNKPIPETLKIHSINVTVNRHAPNPVESNSKSLFGSDRI